VDAINGAFAAGAETDRPCENNMRTEKLPTEFRRDPY
jgi:hypothetical protein